jgi:hypothetical protein
MANTGEPLINVVMTGEPKMLTGSDQKVHGRVWGFSLSPSQTTRPSANRRSLTHRGT